jgi:hypothetical protein
MNYKYCASIFLVLIISGIGYSQGFISPAGVMISHAHAKGGLMFTYSYMDMQMKDNWSGSEPVSDEQVWNDYLYAPQRMHMGMHMLMGMYGWSNRFSLMLMTEYKSSSMTMSLPAGYILHHQHGDSTQVDDENVHEHVATGFGDIKLWAVYNLAQTENSSVVFSAGMSIPTGRINIEAGEHAIYPGERQPYMMQPGTGTVDFLPGITYLSMDGDFTWSIQALSTVRLFDNKAGYHYGSDLTLNAWAAYPFTAFLSASLRLEGYTSAAISGFDPQIYYITQPGANPDCYGGKRVSSYAGVNFYIQDGWFYNSKIALEFGFPLYQHVNGIQQVPLLNWNASFTKAF